MYLHQRDNGWKFKYVAQVLNRLGDVRAKQGLMLGRMSSLGFDYQDEAKLTTMSLDLLPSGRSGLHTIEVARYRRGEMQVVSGPMGYKVVHYEAPKPDRIPEEMHRFIE